MPPKSESPFSKPDESLGSIPPQVIAPDNQTNFLMLRKNGGGSNCSELEGSNIPICLKTNGTVGIELDTDPHSGSRGWFLSSSDGYDYLGVERGGHGIPFDNDITVSRRPIKYAINLKEGDAIFLPTDVKVGGNVEGQSYFFFVSPAPNKTGNDVPVLVSIQAQVGDRTLYQIYTQAQGSHAQKIEAVSKAAQGAGLIPTYKEGKRVESRPAVQHSRAMSVSSIVSRESGVRSSPERGSREIDSVVRQLLGPEDVTQLASSYDNDVVYMRLPSKGNSRYEVGKDFGLNYQIKVRKSGGSDEIMASVSRKNFTLFPTSDGTDLVDTSTNGVIVDGELVLKDTKYRLGGLNLISVGGEYPLYFLYLERLNPDGESERRLVRVSHLDGRDVRSLHVYIKELKQSGNKEGLKSFIDDAFKLSDRQQDSLTKRAISSATSIV